MPWNQKSESFCKTEPESIVFVKLEKVECEEKDGKGDDGWWRPRILFHSQDLFFGVFNFLRSLSQLEALPYAEGKGEGKDGDDGVDVAEASEDNVSQLLHDTPWPIL